MSKISTVYFIVNTITSGEKQFELLDIHSSLPDEGVDNVDKVLNCLKRVEFDVRDEIVKNIMDFSIAYRNRKII